MVRSQRQAYPSPAATALGVDTSRFPLVAIEFSAHPSANEKRALVDAITRLMARGERCGLVVDMLKLDPLALDALARRELAALYSANLDARRRALICVARVIEAPQLRGIAVAFDWVVESSWPCATFTSRALAEAWVQEKISADARS